MKKFLFLCAMALAMTSLFAQENVTLTFTGKNANGNYVQLHQVIVKNITRNWEDTLTFPDTIIVLGNVGINDNVANQFSLSQNVPNPFDGRSDFTVQTPDAGDVLLEVHDLQGRQITYYKNELPQGLHFFRVQLNTAQSYVLTATFGKSKKSIKIINKGEAGINDIQYLGYSLKNSISVKLDTYRDNSTKPFTPGDYMSYMGIAIDNGIECQSETIEQQQYVSESFDLLFPSIIDLPTVTTDAVSNICFTADCGGEVVSDGGATVTARGVCWSTNPNPTITDLHTVEGTGLGHFTSTITSLDTGALYYVRAYATNSKGTAYGQQRSFIAPSLPTILATVLSVVTSTSVIIQGNIASNGESPVTARGVCWSTSQNPTINDNHTINGAGSGEFMCSLLSVDVDTTYYVRLYATNCFGTAYSEELTFTTSEAQNFICGNSMVTDYDANLYHTLQLGDQCWLKEDIRSEHYSDGTFIEDVEGHSLNDTIPYRFPYYTMGNYGQMYNWAAAMRCAPGSNSSPSGVQGICPDGWHLPSINEWVKLNNYIGSQSQYVCGDNSAYVAKALAFNDFWETDTGACSVGHLQQTNNTTQFSAYPMGLFAQSNYPYYTGEYACFWSSSPSYSYNDDVFAYHLRLRYNTSQIHTGSILLKQGVSVRCLKDYGELAAVTTDSVSNITGYGAKCGGNVVYDGNASIIACGICWSTSPEPTIADDHTAESTDENSFISIMRGLSANTTYYVRAYVTNALGTAYGNEVSFATTDFYDFVCEIGQALDCDNNIYNTVQIGSQCWMKDNLRVEHYGDGTPIALGDTLNRNIPFRYYPNGDSANVSTYGYLYNRTAIMHNESSSNTTPGKVQGVCPNGWHLPSDAEWSILASYVGSQTQYQCDSSISNIAKALASKTEWRNHTISCAVGNNPNMNNATRFTALPAGYFENHSYASNYNWGGCAYFWTSTQYNTNSLLQYVRYLQYNSAELNRYPNNVQYAYSVRCLKNYILPPTVTTNETSNVDINSALSGGIVIADGGDSVIARGVCWSTIPNPTTDDNNTVEGGGTGSFTSTLTGLTEGTTYYVRAYATNSAGTAYGAQVSFTTNMPVFDCGTATVCDYDGNVYHTLQLGTQCWTKENMRTEHYSDGTEIPLLGLQYQSTGPNRHYPNNNSSNVATYGYLYTRNAALNGLFVNSNAVPSGIQGVCPTGWHVPSVAEWDMMLAYVQNQSRYQCGSNASNIATALASTEGWNISSNPCAVGNVLSNNNATGFSAMPAGVDGYYPEFGEKACFWTTKMRGGSLNMYDGMLFKINYDSSSVTSLYGSFQFSYSVRCIKNEYIQAVLPIISIDTFRNITPHSAQCDITVISDGGSTVTVRGVCWDTMPNPNIEDDNHTTDGTSFGSFTSELTSLSEGLTYFVRPYATNSVGTVYGDERTFATPLVALPTVSTNTVTDIGSTRATAGGEVIADGGETIIARGVCWNTAPNPTTSNSHTTDSIGVGTFISNITGLTASTTYYLRAYATNAAGTSYGDESTFTTLDMILPTVTTDTLYNIMTSSAIARGTVVNDGNDAITACGVCWSTSPNPTITDDHTSDNTGTGHFVSNITGLDPASTYYLRAYATNSIGTAYGEDISFNTFAITLPTVSTNTVSDITSNSAIAGGNVLSDGGDTIIARGVCWSIYPDPTVDDSHTTDGSGIGGFVSNISGLSVSTTYYLRAYATNSLGTAYGNYELFTTSNQNIYDGQPCFGDSTVSDYDGNTYHTIQIGNQCWMKENLRSEHYSNGSNIAFGSDTSSSIPYRYYPNNNNGNVPLYGYLYNWTAVMNGSSSSNANPSGVQGICPYGWHVPSDAELTQLTNYVSLQDPYQCSGNASHIAKALATNWGWDSNAFSNGVVCAVGNTQSTNNATGFSIVPAGGRNLYTERFSQAAQLWSTTSSGKYAYGRELHFHNATVSRLLLYSRSAVSVRCLRD